MATRNSASRHNTECLCGKSGYKPPVEITREYGDNPPCGACCLDPTVKIPRIRGDLQHKSSDGRFSFILCHFVVIRGIVRALAAPTGVRVVPVAKTRFTFPPVMWAVFKTIVITIKQMPVLKLVGR